MMHMAVKHPLIGASGVALSGGGMIIAGQAISALGSGITTFGMVVAGVSAVGMVVGGVNDKAAAPAMFTGIAAGIGMSIAGSVMAVAGQVISIGGAVALGGSGCLAGYGIIKTYAENKHRLHWTRNAGQISDRVATC